MPALFLARPLQADTSVPQLLFLRKITSPGEDVHVNKRRAVQARFDLAVHVDLVGMMFAALFSDHYCTYRSVIVPDAVFFLLSEAAASGFHHFEWTDGAYRGTSKVIQTINRCLAIQSGGIRQLFCSIDNRRDERTVFRYKLDEGSVYPPISE